MTTWFQVNYIGWQAFTFRGHKFLSLTKRDHTGVCMYDSEMHNYGAFESVEHFKRFALKYRDITDLILDPPDEPEIKDEPVDGLTEPPDVDR